LPVTIYDGHIALNATPTLTLETRKLDNLSGW
jgi:hypothetical protein